MMDDFGNDMWQNGIEVPPWEAFYFWWFADRLSHESINLFQNAY